MVSSPPSPGNDRRRLYGFFIRRERWSLSWSGKLLVFAALAAALMLFGRRAHAFLAITRPMAANTLVIEGWIPDYALNEAVREYQRGLYQRLLTVGPITADGWSSEPRYTSADWATGRLRKLGVTNNVVTLPCRVERSDRTFNSALMVRYWLSTNDVPVSSVNVVTLGAHARRTRFLFEKALGNQVHVGVIALEDRDYDPNHWWRSSDGARSVVGEMLAYLYSRFCFFPGEPTP